MTQKNPQTFYPKDEPSKTTLLGAKTTSRVSRLERLVEGFPLIPLIISVLWVEVGHGARNKLLFVTLCWGDFTQKRMWERVMSSTSQAEQFH